MWARCGRVRPGRAAALSCADQLQDCGSYRQLSFAVRGCAGVAAVRRRDFCIETPASLYSAEHEPLSAVSRRQAATRAGPPRN